MGTNIDLLKQALDIGPDERIRVTEVSNGYNIRYLHTYRKDDSGYRVGVCAKCGERTLVHQHHIIARSAGGADDEDNFLDLCFRDHVGDNGIHLGKWSILDLVDEDTLMALKQRYNVI